MRNCLNCTVLTQQALFGLVFSWQESCTHWSKAVALLKLGICWEECQKWSVTLYIAHHRKKSEINVFLFVDAENSINIHALLCCIDLPSIWNITMQINQRCEKWPLLQLKMNYCNSSRKHVQRPV